MFIFVLSVSVKEGWECLVDENKISEDWQQSLTWHKQSEGLLEAELPVLQEVWLKSRDDHVKNESDATPNHFWLSCSNHFHPDERQVKMINILHL
jgi:hypothetical protein